MSLLKVIKRLALASMLLMVGAHGTLAASNQFNVTAPSNFPLTAATIVGSGYANLRWMTGIVADGSTNNCTPITNAMTYAAAYPGTQFLVPSGTYAVASTCTAFSVPANTTISCGQRHSTVFKMTGSAVLANWFTASNPNSVYFNDCAFYGNNQGTGDTAAGAIWFDEPSGASGAVADFGCNNCKFDNFKAPIWVSVTNHGAYPMSGMRFPNLTATSYSGNDIDPTLIGQLADVLVFRGQFNNAGGTISDIVVDGMECNATWIKTCVTFYDATFNAHVTNAYATGCGAHTDPDTKGYCFLAYQLSLSNSEPDHIFWNGITCDNPFSNCIYVAAASSLFLTDIMCTGQTDTANSILLKGCVSLNQPKNATIKGLTCLQSFNCFGLQNDASSTVDLTHMVARSNIASATGIRILPLTFTNTASRFIASDVEIALTGADSVCTYVISVSGQPTTPGWIQMSGGRQECVGFDFFGHDNTTAGGVVSEGISLSNIYFGGAITGVAISQPTSTTPLQINNITIDGTNFAAAGVGIGVGGETGLQIHGLTLTGKAAGGGTMISVTGAQGFMDGVQFVAVGPAQRYTAPDFGTVKPTFNASQATFVQNLNEACAAGSATRGWANDNASTTWTTRVVSCS